MINKGPELIIKLRKHILNILFVSFIPISIVSVIGMVMSISFSKIQNTLVDLSIVLVSLVLGLILCPYVYVRKLYKISLADLGFKKITIKEILIFIVSLISLFIIIISTKNDIYKISVFSIQMLIVAVCEEFWGRGVLCYLLGKITDNKYIIIMLSSIIFTFITHANRPILENLIYRFPGALIMGIIYVNTKNIRYSMLFHYCYNLINL